MFFFCSPKHTYSTCHGLELLTPWICSTETQFFLLLIATQHKNINKENRKAWIRIGYLNVQCIWRRYNKRISKPVKSSQAPLCKNGKNDRSSYLTIYIYIFFFSKWFASFQWTLQLGCWFVPGEKPLWKLCI